MLKKVAALSTCRMSHRDPQTGARNVGCYRMQVFDEHTTAMHWQVHKVGARHGKLYYERNERMPVAVTIGGDPAYTFAATAPLPDGLDEILFAGFLRKKSVELIKCLTNELEVPADVDFVLEGYVQPGEMRPEGPFGDHTGFTPRRGLPGLSSHRDHASARGGLPDTIVAFSDGRFLLGSASVRISCRSSNDFRRMSTWRCGGGRFHNLVFVSIRKTYPTKLQGDARPRGMGQ